MLIMLGIELRTPRTLS
jgi:hypothetical protein